ncbi:MAG: Filamentous hemagglutinin [Candidatus Heimdallarchaeota archaeon LC_3]|nr:MAG: Filamentous hemagglutinin [Candidatus Heimdallarchaeota archaeon LC_3]
MRTVIAKTQGLWVALWGLGVFLLVGALLILLNVFELPTGTGNLGYTDFIYAGSILLVLGISFGLSTTKGSEREFIFRLSPIWFIMIILGIFFNLNAILKLFAFESNWESWFYLAIPLLTFGLIFLFGSMKDETRNTFSKFWLLYLLLVIIGLVIGILSIVGIYDILGTDHTVGSAGWNHYPVYGLIPMALGLIPLAYTLSANDSLKDLLNKLWIVWLLLAILSIVVYILAALDILLANNVLLINDIGREPGLLVALPFALVGFILFFSSTDEKVRSIVKPLLPVWIVLTFAGLIIFSLNSLIPDTFDVSTYGLGFMFILFSSGLVYKSLSYDFLPTLSIQGAVRTVSSSGQYQGKIEDSDLLQKASVDEATVYLNVQKKSMENSMTQLQNAFRSGRISQAFHNAVSSSLQGKITGYEDQISTLRVSSKRSTRKSIFEEELGIKQEVPPAQQASQPAPKPQPQAPPASKSPPPSTSPTGPTQPVSAPTGPPKPPGSASPPSSPPAEPTPPSGPPAPPGIPSPDTPKPATPKPATPSGPPEPPGLPSSSGPSPPGMPPASPSVGPPAPPGAGPPPLPGGQSSGPAPGPDVVGSARSTSIAELRGEMLKELRRLRDIFKEDQK